MVHANSNINDISRYVCKIQLWYFFFSFKPRYKILIFGVQLETPIS